MLEALINYAALCVYGEDASPRVGYGLYAPSVSTDKLIQFLRSVRTHLNGIYFYQGMRIKITGAETSRVEIEFSTCLGTRPGLAEEAFNYPEGIIQMLVRLDE